MRHFHALSKRAAITMTESTDELTRKLNQETAKIPWIELQRFFASGNAVFIAPELDLIDVARHFSNDKAEHIQALMASQQVCLVDDKVASSWVEENASVWAVVVAPWVLVKAIKEPS